MSDIDIKNNINLNQNEIKNSVFDKRDSAPLNPIRGQYYYNTNDNLFYIFDGSNWNPAGNSIIDVSSLPTTNIKENIVYRLKDYKYYYDGTEIQEDSFTKYNVDNETLFITNGVLIDQTDPEEIETYNLPTTSISSSLIDAWIYNGQFVESDSGALAYINNYIIDLSNKITEEINYELYCNNDGTPNGWMLITSTNDSASYPSLSNKPKINNIEVIGNQPDSYYHISKELTEEEYNNLSNEEQNNGTTYYIDAGGISSNVNETNYNNLTNKPSINGVTLKQGQTANDLDMYTRSQVDAKMSGIFKYKGVVATINNLPSSTSKAGDCYYVTAETSTYAFNGSAWENIGSTVDLTNYQTATDNSLETTSKTIVGGINELNSDKVNISSIIDNLTTTATNVPLSANQGKVLNDKVELRELLSNKTTTIDNTSTDTQYPSAKAVYDGFSPISSSWIFADVMNTSANNAVCPFPLHGHTFTSNDRVAVRGLFLAGIVDPISSGGLYGIVETIQQAYLSSGSNIFIEQVFTNKRLSNYLPMMKFRRQGYVYQTAGIDLTDTSTFLNKITWQSWYPIEYPNLALTLDDTVVGVNSRADLSVTGGIATIRFNNLSFKSNIGTSATMFDRDTRLSILRINKYQIASTAGSYVWNVLISTDPTKSILVCCNPQLYAWGAVANVGYYGLITIPLGY